MPIKRTSSPWFFTPNLNDDAKVLLIGEMNLMVRFFTMAHGCPSTSYVFTYFRRIEIEIKLSSCDTNKVASRHKHIPLNKEDILMELARYLSSSRQRNYCKDILNTLALHLSNEVNDYIVTEMLNQYIDEYIDRILN